MCSSCSRSSGALLHSAMACMAQCQGLHAAAAASAEATPKSTPYVLRLVGWRPFVVLKAGNARASAGQDRLETSPAARSHMSHIQRHRRRQHQ